MPRVARSSTGLGRCSRDSGDRHIPATRWCSAGHRPIFGCNHQSVLPRERVLPREFHWPDRRRSERRGTIERVPSIKFWNRKPERFALALRSTSRLHFRRDKVERISASSLVRFRWPLLLSVAGRAGGALFGLMGAVADLSLPEIKSGRIHGAIRPGLAGRECGQHPEHRDAALSATVHLRTSMELLSVPIALDPIDISTDTYI